MKRNESILVYGVTGLLLVILVVAVVFGNDGTPATPRETANAAGASAADLADILNLDPAKPLSGEDDAEEPAGGSDQPPVAGGVGDDVVVTDLIAAAGAGQPAAQPAPPPAPSPAAGTVRIGDYRQVTVKTGDTFSNLVQRWCGSTDYLPLARALNEDVDPTRLRVGRRLLLPWVDDDLLTVQRAEAAAAAVDAPVRRETVPLREETVAAAGIGESYQLKSGDSLWRIAVKVTGSQGAAPSYIERILELNPGLEPERLRIGQEILLPQ